MKTSRYPFYFVLPALLLYAAFFIVPSIAGIGYAFTDWSPYSEQVNFIGWDAVLTKLPLILATSVLMPALAAFIALRKYLKV